MLFRKLLPIVLLSIVAGCSGTSNTQAEREQSRKNWHAARAGVLANLAKQQYEVGNLADCRKSLDEAAKLQPSHTGVKLLSARVNIEQGRLETAEAELQALRAAEPNNAEADYLSGIIYQRWEQPQAALDHYTSASTKAPAELPYLLARAELLVTLDRTQAALDLLLEKLSYFENSPAIRDAVGQMQMKLGRPAEAAVVFKQATILAPDELPFRERYASALYYSREYRDAAPALEKLLAQEPYAKRGDLWTMLGESQMVTERPRDARDSFERVTELQPAQVSAWVNHAKAAMAINDPRRAELSLKKALTLSPEYAEAHLLLGFAESRQGRLDAAIGSFRTASSLDPSDPVAICMIGYVLEQQGKPAEAIAHYSAALKLNPEDELAATLLARVRADE